MLMVELDEMEPVLAGLVSRIGSLSNSAPIDVLARAGNFIFFGYLSDKVIVGYFLNRCKIARTGYFLG